MALRNLYPERAVFKTHRLPVSDIHELYVEECGNPEGQPVLWCHGGPGGGLFPAHGRAFDPTLCRVILFDQRGAGQSTPFADTRQNTTQDLISDIEKIRTHLGIDKWIVAGRSWGTTLSLLYAEAHPDRVQGLFLAAVFLCDKKSSHWLFQDGASRVFSEAWADFEALVPESKRDDMTGAYHDMMFGTDTKRAIQAARAWSTWEAHTVSLLPDENILNDFTNEGVMLAIAKLECHYLGNPAHPPGFVAEGQILRDAHRIAHIPTAIIHGRYDMNCLYDGAYRLHKALPESKLFTVDRGAHAANDPETIDAQVRAADMLLQTKKP
ncbi:MAG: prolyl aminopeptidase [Alphaproteobacteria bacterium]|nr:prolyl aminopeptidase [Alphaproteobacteria bacterium]